ncbi:MAG: LLM class flavin-dependent oxidoreductase [Sphingobium sp.]
MADFRMRHGIFMAPYHALDENPTICLRRDLELVQFLDQLGFDEAWFGEHHSSGFETISSPELMIAAAAEMTKRIRLGTGVITLPYHNPLMVAERITQLDHMTMGRAMFGFGPGLLAGDAHMLDISIPAMRDRMVESIEVILDLLDGKEVTRKTEWFSLQNAKVHILPFSQPRPDMVVASAGTPSGGMAAGRFGFGMLCVAATAVEGFDVLLGNWEVAQQIAAENQQKVSRENLRLVGPMHIAETREKAIENVKFGLPRWVDYYNKVAPKGFGDFGSPEAAAQHLIETKRAVIGTPEDAIAQIQRLIDKQGDFGAYLFQATDWADWEQTKKSYELYARYVIPHFAKTNVNRQSSYDWLTTELPKFNERRQQGVDAAFAKYQAHKDRQGQ